MATKCKICDAEIPPRIGRGRPRTRCESCAPPTKATPATAPVVAIPPRPSDGVGSGSFRAEILAKLEDAGQADSVYGVIALRAAGTIDGGVSGSAEAVLLDRVSRNVEMALKATPKQAGKLDELRRRRERRTG